MVNIPAIRWGKPYTSLDVDQLVHFLTGEPVARVSQVNAGMVRRDARHARRAQDVLRELSSTELIACCRRAGELFTDAELPLGDGAQTADDFRRAQSATTGLPLHMCQANMQKNAFVLTHMDEILASLTRGLDRSILTRGYGDENHSDGGRGATVSYQAQAAALGAVLPSNSPGVHTLWLPVIPLQVGLVLKPGSQEPWTPFRITAALVEAGIPAEAISVLPGSGADIGAAVLESCRRSMIFGGPDTVARYHGDPQVQVHGPGYSKILLGDDRVDRWQDYLDLIVESVLRNGGRSCINCSAIYASRHAREIASALAEWLGPVDVRPPEDPEAQLAAFTVEGAAAAIWRAIDADLQAADVEHMTAAFGDRLVERSRCGYLRPVVAHCESPECAIAGKEFMFPMASVVSCPQQQMISSIGPTLVCTAITDDESFRRDLIDATHIDRLNLGPIPTTQIDWLQPHEGNLFEFLYLNRALQVAD